MPPFRINYAAKTGHLFIIVRTDDGRTVLVHKKQEQHTKQYISNFEGNTNRREQ